MSEYINLFFTVVVGVSIFVIGQWVMEFIFKPLRSFEAVRLDIAHKLVFHESSLVNSDMPSYDRVEWARSDMRDLASNLYSKYVVIPKYIRFLCRLPNQADVGIAFKELIYLSNTGGGVDNKLERRNKAILKIRKNLNIELVG